MTPDENVPSSARQGRQVPAGTDMPPEQIYHAKAGAQPQAEGEVVGHSRSLFVCYAGDWSGWVPDSWTYFICPNGHVNYP